VELTPVIVATPVAVIVVVPTAPVELTPVIVGATDIIPAAVPTALIAPALVTDKLAFAVIEALPTEPMAATPVTAMLKSVKAVTGLTLPFNWLVANVAVAPAATDTPLTTAEPCTEPRVSPLWFPVTDTVPTPEVPATPVATISCSPLPASEKAEAEYGEKPNMLCYVSYSGLVGHVTVLGKPAWLGISLKACL
jgi:hypothetical protein